LLLALSEEAEIKKARQLADVVLINNEDANVWPPWPWPPWGGDDDDNDGGDKPHNRTLEIQKLAREVVKFERKLAQASLDLYVHGIVSTASQSDDFGSQGDHAAGSSCHLQPCSTF
jgi:endothelin-converting enzyme